MEEEYDLFIGMFDNGESVRSDKTEDDINYD